ncbi:MAG: hypothetical protein RL177_1418 [Bacteroidota bacterium]|jgi:hypothetical protein
MTHTHTSKERRSKLVSIPKRSYEAIEAIPDFQDLTLSETISQFVYQSLDLFTELGDLTEAELNDVQSSMQKKVAAIFDRIIERDGRIPFINRFVFKPFVFDIMAWQYVQLIRFWLTDDSEGSEQTLALVDKSTAFFQELAYSGVLDKGMDLGKFVYSQVRGHKG